MWTGCEPMSGLTLGIVLSSHIAAVVACILVCRYYLKRCQAFADNANDAAHDAYNYMAGLVSTDTDTDNDTGTDQPEHGAGTTLHAPRPGHLAPDDEPTLFLPPVGGRHIHEDDPEVLFTHGQQQRARAATGKHHLTDVQPPQRLAPVPRHQRRS